MDKIAQQQHNQPVDGSNFDEVPIGSVAGPQKFMISQYANGETPQNIVQSTANMTLQQKLQSKAIKVKLQGLEQLKNALADQERGNQIQIDIAKILKQSNPACLQRALQCAEKWIQIGRFWGEKQIKQVIENGYINGKGSAKKIANDLIFKTFETKPDEVQRCIVEVGLKSKVPKIAGGYFTVINELLQQFGIKDLKYLKPYLPNTINVMNNQKLPALKAQGMNVFKNGLKWLGKDFIWPLLSQLKQNMKKELETFWQSHDKKEVMKANRQKNDTIIVPKVAGAKSKSKQSGKSSQMPLTDGGLDIYEISDPIQIFQKFDEKWSDNVLETQKWNSKTALLQQIINKASVPKIANSEHRHITEMMRRLINDSNFNVVLAILKLAGALAKGLRKNFTHSAKILFPYITPKFRDKKTQMIEETFNTLNNFCYCFSIEEVAQDVKTALKDKAAGMKSSTLRWILAALQKGSDRSVQFFKSNSVHTIFQSLLNDPNAQVRESAAKVVCKVKSYFGDNLFKNIDKNINNKDILSKLSEGIQGDENLAKSRSKDNKELSSKKQRTQSKPKNTKNQEQQQISKKAYVIKSSTKTGQDFDSVDITEELNKHMKKLNDGANWQNRKEAAETLIRYFSQLEKQNSSAKITSSIMHDFLGVLRSRISDPNKQLIKLFVQLIGEVFRCLTEKQAKMQAKTYIQDLMEVYADKNDQNKRQVEKTFDRIAVTLGHQAAISCFGQLLSQQSSTASATNQMASVVKQRTLEYLSNADYFTQRVQNIQSANLKQFKEFPKIVLIGLCDKSKQLRSISERVFKILTEKIGTQIFRNMVNSKIFNDGKLAAFKNDLTNFLDKFQGTGPEQPSMISNGSNLSLLNDLNNKRSPALSKSKINDDASVKNRRKMSNVSITSNNSLCNSRSKPKNSSVLINCQESNRDYMSNLSFYLKDNASLDRKSPIVQGSQPFAPLQFLTAQRIIRQQSNTNISITSHPIISQTQLKSQLSITVNNNDLYIPMYSSSYSKVNQSVTKLIKLCRDIAYVQAIRQIGDLLLKWVTVRLYGGNVAVIGVMELVCPVLSVLEKKKVVWGETEVDICVFVMREYLVTYYYAMLGNTHNIDTSVQIIKNMFKIVISLSSGERVIRKLLQQLKQDPSQFHRHLSSASSRSSTPFPKFYKKQIVLLCSSFIQYFSNDTLLEEASNIPELSQDVEFGRLLGNKFCDSVLKDFGFKTTVEGKNYGPGTVVVGVNLEKSFINAANQKNSSITNDIGSPRNASPAILAGLKSDQKDQKAKKVTPQKRNANQSHFPPPSPVTKPKTSTQVQLSLDTSSNTIHTTHNNTKKQSSSLTLTTFYRQQKVSDANSLQSYIISPSAYPCPNPHNPLGSNLLKLYPYNQSSIHFFSTLFLPSNSSNPKITAQLQTHSNTIYSYLFHTMQRTLSLEIQSRQNQHPDRPLLLLSLIQHAIKCSTMFIHVNQQLVEKSIRYVVTQLVYQDQNRNHIEQKYRSRGITDYKPDGFVKAVNGIILRLLDNSEPMFIINTLLFHMIQLMLEQGNTINNNGMPVVNKAKKVGLLIRCLVRVTNTYFIPCSSLKQKQKQCRQLYNIQQNPSCLKPAQIQKFITLCYSYMKILQINDLSQFQAKQLTKQTNNNNNSNNNNTDEHIALCLCKILRVLGRKGLLIKGYQAAIKDQKVDQEKIIGDFVMVVTGVNTNQLDQGNILGTSNYQHQVSTNLIDQELKKIIQLLSKTKTFSQGVKSLKVYIHQQNGSKFDYRAAFAKMNFEIAFIDKVGEQLAKLNNPMEGSVGRSINPDIQNKLQRLKMKLECINNEHSKSSTSKNSSHIDPPLSSKPAVHQQSSSSSSSTYHPSGQSSSLLSGCQTPKSGTQFFNPLSSNTGTGTGSMTPSTSSTTYMAQTTLNTQNDLKRKIEQMKNKVSMSTANHNNNNSSIGFSYGNATSAAHHTNTSTNKIR